MLFFYFCNYVLSRYRLKYRLNYNTATAQDFHKKKSLSQNEINKMNDSRQKKNPKTDTEDVQGILFFVNKTGVGHKRDERILENNSALRKPNTRGENEGPHTKIGW